MQNPKFTIFSGADKQYYFRLRAGNVVQVSLL